jgi:hypothetical protein
VKVAGEMLEVGRPVVFAEMVTFVAAVDPLYDRVTFVDDDVTVVVESVNAPVLSLFVNVTGLPYAPMIVLPSESLSVTVIGVVAFVPDTKDVCPAEI